MKSRKDWQSWWTEMMEEVKPFLRLARFYECSIRGGSAPAVRLAALGLVVPAWHRSEGVQTLPLLGKEEEKNLERGYGSHKVAAPSGLN